MLHFSGKFSLTCTKKKKGIFSHKALLLFLKLPQIRVLASQQFLPDATRERKLWERAAVQSPLAAGKSLRPLCAGTVGV